MEDILSFVDVDYLKDCTNAYARWSNYTAPNSAYWLLSIASDADENSGKAIIEFLRKEYCQGECFDYVLWNLSSDVLANIAVFNKKSEQDIYNLFNNNYSKIYDGKVTSYKNNPKCIPDSWVLKDGEYIPVEMKLHNFNKQALKQLNRCIDFCKCKHGIAVGEKLTVELPKNITFVSIDTLLKAAKVKEITNA